MRHWIQLPTIGMITALLSGCTQVIPWLINPTGAATATANSVATSLTSIDTNSLANSTARDLDRILQENPNAVNGAELRELRNEVAQQSQIGIVTSSDDLPTEYKAQFDRRAVDKERKKKDLLVVRTNEQYLRPRGIRATPRSHLSNEPLPATQEHQPLMDISPIRCGN